VPAHSQDLAGWLVTHQLTTGIGGSDVGAVTTLDSGGRVQLRVVAWPGRTAVPRAYQSQASWYDARRNYATFVVNGPPSVIPNAEIVNTFGRPAQTYQYGPYTIMVWRQNLFAQLSGPPTRGPGNF
jgi:hypothetical protein